MANMSYCRFENTSRDLSDCVEYLYEQNTLKNLGKSEKRYAKELLQDCLDLVELAEALLDEDE